MTTKEVILKRLKGRVSNLIDKREGSVVHDALAPASVEFEDVIDTINTTLANTFAGTADRDWLIKRCAEIGIAPFEATYAYRKGIFTPSTLEIAIGERFSYEGLNFIVIEKLEDGVYSLRCEETGEGGNYGEGRLVPIEYVNGLETATLDPEVLIYGEEEEDTETLRQRYFDTLPTMTLDGNIAQYKKWCREYTGIGNHKIFPLWNGKNTVKVSILSSENTIASQELIDDFQEYLDPPTKTVDDNRDSEEYPQGRGMGNGKAPIGAIVTVVTAAEVPVNIEATVSYKSGYNYPIGLEESIREYLLSLNYNRNIVSYVAISAIFQNNEAIDLVLDVTVNGGKTNFTLGEEEVATLGTLNVNGGVINESRTNDVVLT